MNTVIRFRKKEFRYFCLFLIAGCLLILVGCKESTTGIKFNHQSHLGRGIDCEFCHTQAMTAAAAGVPSMDICANCHSIDTTKPSDKCLLCHIKPGQPVKPLVPAGYKPVVFSHQLHTQTQHITCDKCHPSIAKSKMITSTQFPAMEACIACHKKGKGPLDCAVCHPGLDIDHPPLWHTGNWNKVHGLRSTDKKTRCTTCHTKTACATCHQEQEPESHNEFWKKRGHALQVSWNRSNCQVCHKADFCQRCHQETPPSSHVSRWEYRHCRQCHFPLKDNGCFVCHKSVDHTQDATKIPQWMYNLHCTDCHFAGNPDIPDPRHPAQYPCIQCHIVE